MYKTLWLWCPRTELRRITRDAERTETRLNVGIRRDRSVLGVGPVLFRFRQRKLQSIPRSEPPPLRLTGGHERSSFTDILVPPLLIPGKTRVGVAIGADLVSLFGLPWWIRNQEFVSHLCPSYLYAVSASHYRRSSPQVRPWPLLSESTCSPLPDTFSVAIGGIFDLSPYHRPMGVKDCDGRKNAFRDRQWRRETGVLSSWLCRINSSCVYYMAVYDIMKVNN